MTANPTEQENREALASLLDGLAAGVLTADDALDQIRRLTGVDWIQKDFADAFHAVQHFATDADIRAREPDYAGAQSNGLRAFASRLRHGA